MGFRVQGYGFAGLGLRVKGCKVIGFRIQRLGLRV